MNLNLQGLSVVIIARNAEKTIAKCLQSASPIANEIIVVINDCDDETKNIAELYGAKVVEHKWSGFRDQKNFAATLATCDWVLSLDADEAVSECMKQAVKDFINQDFQTYVGAKFARKTFFLDKWVAYGGWYPDYVTRLFKKGHGRFVGGSVHEKLEVYGKVKCLSGEILHYPCESLMEFTIKNVGYAELGAQDLFRRYSTKCCRFWTSSIVNAIIRSAWKFFKCYILRLGFLDGTIGFYIAKSQSFLTFYKYFRFRTLLIHRK